VARCIVVLVDGLRPDAVTPGHMPVLHQLGSDHTRAAVATTVRPSVTVAALTSLATGVAPETHGLVEPGLAFLRRLGALRPIARELRAAGVPTLVSAGPIALRSRPIAWALVSCAGVTDLACADRGTPDDVVRAGIRALDDRGSALAFLYLSDCDRAGHAHGWMSPAYLAAAGAVDRALARLTEVLEDTLVIVLSDHGGGGVEPRDHDWPHPLNDRIPVVLAGAGVRRRYAITRPVSLLDIPPTLLAWFGAPIPAGYEGTALTEAFVSGKAEEAA
jgi:hypothetical protein